MNYRSSGIGVKGLGAIVVGGLLAVSLGVSVFQHSDRAEYDVFVNDTERVTTSDGDGNVSSKYVVFTVDKEGVPREFENTDSLMECFFDECKFDSSSVHNTLVQADKNQNLVHIETYGWRIPFLSMYPNIVEATVVKE